MSIEYVDITPHKSLMVKLGQAGYSLSEAVAELVDNSVDASLPDKKLIIDIIIDKKKIVVRDNGFGMPKEILAKVLKLGFSTKESTTMLGKFGLGLKTSCLSMGLTFKITTSPTDKDEKYSITFDEKEWMEKGDWLKYPLEINPIKNESFTEIEITNLIIDPAERDIKELKDDLSSRFGPFIKSNSIEILINKAPCKPMLPELTKDGKQEIKIKLESGKEIIGWFGFKLAGALKNQYGFNTFRNKRLITIYDKIGLVKDQKSKQVVGEIHIDHVPVSHNKRQWITESKEYKEVERALTEYIRNYDRKLTKLTTGISAHPGRIEGIARVLFMGARTAISDAEKIKKGDIIVTSMTRPYFLLQIRRAGAIVTDQGGKLCHAAIVSREFGIPCVVGTQNGTTVIKDGQKIIVDANEGVIYASEE